MSFRNRRTSRFDPPSLGYSSRGPMNYGMNPMQTQEQLAFDLEYTKWENGFSDWKRAYANHPDRVAYRQYEKKFLDVREKLLLKKAQLFGSTLETQFENQLSAASQMATTILQKYGGVSASSYEGGYVQKYGQHQSRSRSPVFRNKVPPRPGNFGNQFNARDESFHQSRQGNQNSNRNFSAERTNQVRDDKRYRQTEKYLDPKSIYPNIPW